MTLRDKAAQREEFGNDPGGSGPDSAGQSGDSQGLSSTVDRADGRNDALADGGQAYEPEGIEGVDDAGNHPERPVHIHQGRSPLSSAAPDEGWE